MKISHGPAVICVMLWGLFPLATSAADGLLAHESPFSVSETMDRLEATIEQRGLNLLARVDHAAGAERAGMSLRPTTLLIFGNPQGGTPLMQCAQTMGIDLPLKVLAWEDENGQVWIGYNAMSYLSRRYGTGDCPAVERLEAALSGIVSDVVSP